MPVPAGHNFSHAELDLLRWTFGERVSPADRRRADAVRFDDDGAGDAAGGCRREFLDSPRWGWHARRTKALRQRRLANKLMRWADQRAASAAAAVAAEMTAERPDAPRHARARARAAALLDFTAVRELRRAAGLSQRGLAERLGCAANTVCKIESGRIRLSPGMSRRVAAAVGTA
jgi:DNA-binding transcriptional regulator YiaG